MALKKCKECGNMVSTDAFSCPQCGKRASAFGLIFQFVLVFFLFWGGVVLLGTDYKKMSTLMIPLSIIWVIVLSVIWKIKFR